MKVEDALSFITKNHRATMATVRSDGRPQLSPVLVGADEAGRAVVSSRETAYKTRNLRRNPAVSICVFQDSYFGEWIQIDGQAEILSLPEALEPLVDYYRSSFGEHPDWDEYREAMFKEKRVLIRITIERAGPARSG